MEDQVSTSGESFSDCRHWSQLVEMEAQEEVVVVYDLPLPTIV